MPYTPDEQRIVDHVKQRIRQHTENLDLWWLGILDPTVEDYHDKREVVTGLSAGIHELQLIKELLEDIKATRDKEYPCDQKGE